MEVRYLFKGVLVDDVTREYIEKRLVRIEKLVTETDRFEIEIGAEKQEKKRVEVMVIGPKRHLRAEETTVSIEASIDAVVDDLEMQLAKKNGKIRDLFLRGRRSIKKKLVVAEDARL